MTCKFNRSSDPLWGLDIFISSCYRHTFMKDVYISAYINQIYIVYTLAIHRHNILSDKG